MRFFFYNMFIIKAIKTKYISLEKRLIETTGVYGNSVLACSCISQTFHYWDNASVQHVWLFMLCKSGFHEAYPQFSPVPGVSLVTEYSGSISSVHIFMGENI